MVSDYLLDNNINHGCFYGGMEQKDRERSLIKFRNGTHQVIVATDLAARFRHSRNKIYYSLSATFKK